MVRVIQAAAVSAALLTALPARAAAPEPTKPVDPSAFSGRWYEIARIHNKLQVDCQAATMDFTPTGPKKFTLVQTCRKGSPSGAPKTYTGSGQVVDDKSNAKLKVTYFGFVNKEYWVVDHGGDNWALLATPDGKFMWVLSRKPTLAAKAEVVARARGMGFDLTKLEYDQQPPA